MASELLKNRALIQKLKEPDVPRVKFDLASTGFEELFTLPEPKPQELLDIQEENRKGRLLDSLNKIGGGLMDESVDFIKRERLSNGGFADKLTPKEKRIVLNWGKNKGFTQKKSLEEYNKLPTGQRFLVRKGKVTGKGFSTIKGTVKPLSPENAKLFAKTNPGEVWGEGKFADFRARANWVIDAPRKRKILNETKGLITEKEYAKILSDALGVEIKPKKVEGKYSQGGKKMRTTFGKIAAEDFVDSFGSIKAGGSAGKFKYYKPPTQAQIKKFKTALRSPEFNQLKEPTVNAILKLHKNYEQVYREGNLPIIQDVVSKLKLRPGQAGRATARLAQIYGGHKFKNPELQDIRKNISAANKMFAKMEAAPFGDVYRGGVYEAALETIDSKLGKERGTFASLKSKARQVLQDNKIKGFNINEIAGVTGSSRSGAEFSQFIDVMEENLNQKTLANLQGQLSTARAKIVAGGDFKKIADNYNLKASALESKYNVELPKLIKPGEVETSFGKKRIAELKGQGLDLVSAAKRDKYGISVPKGAMTIEEFLKPENKKTTQLLAALGCPNFKGKQVFQDGGRIEFQTGAAPTQECIARGAEKINLGKIKPGAETRNFAKFFNSAYKLGRGVLKFGIIPEALFVGGETLVRMAMGDTLDEAFLRATEFIRPGDQTSEADKRQIERLMGPENTKYMLNLRNFEKAQQELKNVIGAQQADLALAGEEFDEMSSGETQTDVIEKYKPQIAEKEKAVLDATISQPETLYARSLEDEFEDIKGVKRGKIGRQKRQELNIVDPEDPETESLVTPEITQAELNRRIVGQQPTIAEDIFGDFARATKTPAQQVLDFMRAQEQTAEAVDKAVENVRREQFEKAYEDSALAEQLFGPSRTFAGEPVNLENYEPSDRFQDFEMNRGIYALGGRIGFKDGPKNPGRRAFMKLMAGIASLPILSKFLKPAAPVVEKLANTTTKMPEWFPDFVNKMIFTTGGRRIDADVMEYTTPKLPGVKMLKRDDGEIIVEGRNAYDEPYEIIYRPPGYELVDETTGKAVKIQKVSL